MTARKFTASTAVAMMIAVLTAGCGSDAPAGPPNTPQALAAAIVAQLGDSNLGAPRLVTNQLDPDGTYEVRWQINDNVTQSFVHEGAKMDIFKVIKEVKVSGLPVTKLVMTGGYPLTDVYGHEKNQTVVQVMYSADTSPGSTQTTSRSRTTSTRSPTRPTSTRLSSDH